MTARGMRNNNPGNIDYNGTMWLGLTKERGDSRFCTFEDMVYGCRALIVTLRTYIRVHDRNTIEKIVNRWAPPIENNTEAYIKFVSARTGFKRDEQVYATRKYLIPIAMAIAAQENGESEAAGIPLKTWHRAADLCGL